MKLDVSPIRQPRDSYDCGIACLAMLMEYYGEEKGFDEIKKEIKNIRRGTYAPELGSYMIKNGFDVEIVTLHPDLFTKKDGGMDRRSIEKRLQNTKLRSRHDQQARRHFEMFLKDGGRVRTKIPSIEDITTEIGSGRPLAALMTSRFLKGNAPRFNFHYNVITGFDDRFVYANDPSSTNCGGKNRYLINDFFYGLYASAYREIDGASLIKFKKR